MARVNNSDGSHEIMAGVPNVTRQLTTPRRNASSSDFYICEFPKSGITYLTVLLANAFLSANDYRARATFSSVRNYIVDLCAAEHVESLLFNDPPVRFYKTHSIFSPLFIHSIYLVRHPVDVMVSNLRYARGRDWWSEDDLDSFLEHPVFGVKAWCCHVDSWLLENRFLSDVMFVHLVRYEDLVADPASILGELNKNFGWNLPESAITEAVLLASRQSMRDQEDQYRRYNPNHEFEFVSKEEQSVISGGLSERIIASCVSQLQLLGFS